MPSPSSQHRLLVALLIASLAATPLPSFAQVTGLEEEARVRLRLLRLRIDPNTAANPGECLELGPADLKVTVGGARVAGSHLALERERRPTIHAILIDSSGSMEARMEESRRAARAYLERLRPEDEKAQILSFNDSVILENRPTSSLMVLGDAVDKLEAGSMTSLHDALYYLTHEMTGHSERAVMVVVSDGVDNGSIHTPNEVQDAIADHPNLTLFAIGTGGSKFLRNLAAGTLGKYFEMAKGAGANRLTDMFLEIRELLENEATLTVVDPEPESEPRRVRVSSTNPACDVKVLGEVLASRGAPPQAMPDPPPPLPTRLPAPPAAEFARRDRGTGDAGCLQHPDGPWFLEVEKGSVSGCVLDTVLELGLLYNPGRPGLVEFNQWIDLVTRHISIPVPSFEDLPRRPEELMDPLGRFAVTVRNAELRRDRQKRDGEEHAREFLDYPTVVHGTTFFELRESLAEALFYLPGYHVWTKEKLQAQAERELAALVDEYRKVAPHGITEGELAGLARRSPEGREILRQAGSPAAADVIQHLAGWLGDLPAHDLFARWDELWISGLLAGTPPPDGYASWTELRRVFYLPSHARVLTLLSPVYDADCDCVGYYRVVLPRPSWLGGRIKGGRGAPPMDLVPDLPLGMWAMEQALAGREPLRTYLREHGFRAIDVSYEPLEKPRRLQPWNAFRRTRVRVQVAGSAAGGGPGGQLTVVATVLLDSSGGEPRMEFMETAAAGDPELERLVDVSRQSHSR